MSNTEVPTLLATSTPKDSPVTVETFADVLKLLGIEHLDVDETTQAHAIAATPELLERYGPEWFKEHRVRLIEELEYLNEF